MRFGLSFMSVLSPSTGFGVYLHWPFCAAKCPYCDFNSHVRFTPPDEARYIAAFTRELTHFKSLTGERVLNSIFFGGGTPSLMSPYTVEALITLVTTLWPAAPDLEITLEANPTSVEAMRFQAYRSAGVNRVSMGIQALNDVDLKFLGRMHSAKEAMAAIDVAQKTFPRFSFDLIYARPNQSLAAWQAELQQAISLGTSHLSLYQLTIEEGTPFYALHKAKKFTMPHEDLARDFYDLTQDYTAKAGLPAYEVSNHARLGEESRHNLIYWRMQDYVGAGAGAHGRITNAKGRFATSTHKSPEAWLKAVENFGQGLNEFTPLLPEEVDDETLLMGLRLREGLAFSRLSTPLKPETLQELTQSGHIWQNATHVGVTPLGFPILNAVIAALAVT
jgi:putative oxygen-independent coproporphyrinogen III oxidase